MIRTLNKIWLLFPILIFTAINLHAQSFSVHAKIDSVQMWIGNQTNLQFEITQSPKEKITLPVFSDTIVGNLEIIKPAQVDTQQISTNQIGVRVNYVVTSFKDSLIYIPKYPFVLNEDTVWSNSLSIKIIQPFVVDTASHALADIKPIIQPPFDWKGFILKIILTLLIIALLAVVVWLIKKFRNKPIKIIPQKTIPYVPAHIEALKQLDRLKEEKSWQRGRIKEYHVELTDIIRHYVSRMFNINSMEMTSDEILRHAHFLNVDKKGGYEALRQILTLADLVKFAKYQPSAIDNEMSLMNAYLFVNQTKIEDMQDIASDSSNPKSSTEK